MRPYIFLVALIIGWGLNLIRYALTGDPFNMVAMAVAGFAIIAVVYKMSWGR